MKQRQRYSSASNLSTEALEKVEASAHDPIRSRAHLFCKQAQNSRHGMTMGTQGFTLIELSIVLVIIGLIVGGVLVGQDLIKAAYVRAQISQIESYNTAVNTFYGKYQALPGDMNATVAQQNGFTPRGQYAGEGDGSGVIESISADAPNSNLCCRQGAGETGLFWVDLSSANGLNLNLIDQSFHLATATNIDFGDNPVDPYMPKAKLGQGNYIVVYSNAGANYFSIGHALGIWNGGYLDASPGITVATAHNIDAKIDDGFPQTGRVQADYCASEGGYTAPLWSLAGSTGEFPFQGPSDTSATTGTNFTCYDNGGNGGSPQQYSLEMNGGNAANCGISIQMQAGD